MCHLVGVIKRVANRDAFDIVKEFQQFADPSWYEYFREAKRYFTEHNNLLVPATYISPNGTKLGKWIQKQRSAYKGSVYTRLSIQEIQMLEFEPVFCVLR